MKDNYFLKTTSFESREIVPYAVQESFKVNEYNSFKLNFGRNHLHDSHKFTLERLILIGENRFNIGVLKGIHFRLLVGAKIYTDILLDSFIRAESNLSFKELSLFYNRGVLSRPFMPLSIHFEFSMPIFIEAPYFAIGEFSFPINPSNEYFLATFQGYLNRPRH